MTAFVSFLTGEMKPRFFHENLIPFDAQAKFDDELAELLTPKGLDWILMAGII